MFSFLAGILLLSVGATSPVEAKKSEGSPILETNSDQVCGLKICTQKMTAAEKYAMHYKTNQQQETIVFQQAFNPIMPKISSSQVMGKNTVDSKSSLFMQKMIKNDAIKLFQDKGKLKFDLKKFSKFDAKKSFSKIKSISTIKNIKSFQFTDVKAIKSVKSISDIREATAFAKPAAKIFEKAEIKQVPKFTIKDKLSSNKDFKIETLKPKQFTNIQKDLSSKFKGDENRIPMKIVKDFKLKAPQIKKSD